MAPSNTKSKDSPSRRNFLLSCLVLSILTVSSTSCGGAAQSSSTTARCYDGNGFPYDSNDPEQVSRMGCHYASGVLNEELTKELSNATITTSTTSTTSTTVQEKANWVYKNNGDVFVAPFVQPVCDTLRVWKAPVETTKIEFDEFSEQVAQLKKMIGSPSEPTFSDTYWNILSLAAEALDYERRHPNDRYPGFTLSYGPKSCDILNFTVANSKFGADVNNPTP
jgi:hypothetical protein